ncbi:hypothetical protein SM0020_03390 [Sinorhizobium meliloti CCNWSX0020]|uniref:Uncharacterized protein n=1 Tax=Sinorhizobium meliloti CCNWSX0020 TaxID=1107881 RepID=H0FU51_RHIML|nr:hypothetical protein SM0020_03390 [Sinorhizobium meliloti CCNWSX0020]
MRAAAREPDDSDEGSGLETIERFLVSKFGDKFASRLIVAASVRAISVLIREHPIIAARLLGVGLARAARLGLDDAHDFLQLRGRTKRSMEHPSSDTQPSVPLVGSRAGSLSGNE